MLYFLVFFFVGEYVRVEGINLKGAKNVLYKYDVVNEFNQIVKIMSIKKVLFVIKIRN